MSSDSKFTGHALERMASAAVRLQLSSFRFLDLTRGAFAPDEGALKPRSWRTRVEVAPRLSDCLL